MLLKFFIATLISAALPLAGLLYTNGFKMQEDLEQKIDFNLSQTTDLLASKIDYWNEMNLRLLKQNASLEQMMSGEGRLQKPVLESIVDTYEWLYLAYAIGSDGYKTARSDDKPIYKQDGKNLTIEEIESIISILKRVQQLGSKLYLVEH